MKNNSIEVRLYRRFLLMSLIPLLALGAAFLVFSFRGVLAGRERDVRTRLTSEERQMDSLLSQGYQAGHTIAEGTSVISRLKADHEAGETSLRERLRMEAVLLDIFQYYGKSLSICIVSENGTVYKSTPYTLRNGDLTATEWYEAIRRTGSEQWFELHETSYFDVTADANFVSYGIPVTDEQTGQFLGCVLVEMQTEAIFSTNSLYLQNEEHFLFYPDDQIRVEGEFVHVYENDSLTVIDGSPAGEAFLRAGWEQYNRLDAGETQLSENAKARQGSATAGSVQAKQNFAAAAHAEERQDLLAAAGAIKYWKTDFPAAGRARKNGFVVVYQRIAQTGWYLVSVIPALNYYGMVISLLVLAAAIAAVAVLVDTRVARQFAVSLTRPIRRLKEAMDTVEERNYLVAVAAERQDEIGALTEKFNDMNAHTHELLFRIEEQHKRQRHYELLLLQAQINPHFLYNTLDSLMWLIRLKDGEGAETMLGALIQFFRTGLNKGLEEIKLKLEVENIESYLRIQSMRYRTKLTYSVFLENGLEDFVVPKLILQPLVENAIYHGIKKKNGGGSIAIDCRRRDGAVCLTVRDTGVGMTKETLSRLRKRLESGEVEESDSYGLTNVNDRLHIFFDKACGIHVDSTEGEGTVMQISIDV